MSCSQKLRKRMLQNTKKMQQISSYFYQIFVSNKVSFLLNKLMRSILFLAIVLTLFSLVRCQYHYWYRPYPYTAAIVISVVIVGVLLLIGLIVLVVKKCKLNKRKLKKRYNIVDENSMTQAIYEQRRDLILTGLHSAKINQVFWQVNNNGPSFITVTDVQTKQKKPFLTQVKIKGRDQFGQWESQGYILCKDASIFFWMLKQYSNEIIIMHNGKKVTNVVYQSTSFEQIGGVLSGNWFFEDFEFDPICRGAWSLSCPPSIDPVPPNRQPETQNNLVEDNRRMF